MLLRYPLYMQQLAFQASERHRKVVLDLAATIAAIPTVRRVILYGSRARGDAEERSDFDIAVDAPDASSRDWVTIFELADDAYTLLEIQIVRLHETGEEFRQRVAQEGIVLYERGKE